MHESAPNIAVCFRCNLFVYEWWGEQVSPLIDSKQTLIIVLAKPRKL